MKYSEFKQKMKDLGLTVKEYEAELEIYKEKAFIAKVSKYWQFAMDIGSIISDIQFRKYDIFRAIIELANTPIEEREEEKKYNVVAYETYEGPKGGRKHKMFYYRKSKYTLGTMIELCNSDSNQQWTLQQIRDWGLEDCERIEVKE